MAQDIPLQRQADEQLNSLREALRTTRLQHLSA